MLFLAVGAFSLFGTAMGIIDYTSRLAADVLKTTYTPGASESRMYFWLVWGMVGLGCTILLAGMSQPITLLVISASTAGTMMFLYSFMLIALNRRMLPSAIRISPFRTATLVWSTLMFGSLAALTIYTQVQTLASLTATHESAAAVRIQEAVCRRDAHARDRRRRCARACAGVRHLRERHPWVRRIDRPADSAAGDGARGRRVSSNESGDGVHGFTAGDRVSFDSTVSCGACDFCRRGQINLCDNRTVLGVSCGDYRRHGAFAEYVAVPSRILYKLPDSLPFERAALLESVSIAVHAVSRHVPKPGDTVVVVGAGMIGVLIIQVLKDKGSRHIVAVDVDPQKLALAQRLGATHTLNPKESDVPAAVRDVTGGRGADVSFEVVGHGDTVLSAIRSLRKGRNGRARRQPVTRQSSCRCRRSSAAKYPSSGPVHRAARFPSASTCSRAASLTSIRSSV